LEDVLRSGDWVVTTSAAYTDPQTGKNRELDISAIQAEALDGEFQNWVFLSLLIESINNTQPLALISRKRPRWAEESDRYNLKYVGMPSSVVAGDNQEEMDDLVDYLGLEDFHHYCSGRIARQFASFQRKRQDREWMAHHDDAHFGAFDTLCVAVEHEIDGLVERWTFDEHEPTNIQIYLPVLVLQGQLWDVWPTVTGPRIHDVDWVQFQRTVIVDHREVDYQIDVVTERGFPAYLSLVNDELARISAALRRRPARIRRSVERLAARARDSGDSAVRRECLTPLPARGRLA
jgi:hypothetical protein